MAKSHEHACRQRSSADDPLVIRAAQVDPQRAVCFRGYYGEDFELEDGSIQRQLSQGLIWADPDSHGAVPEWAMQEAWPELLPDWDQLQLVAWERGRRHNEPTPASANVRAILKLEPTASELIDALYRVFASERGTGPPL